MAMTITTEQQYQGATLIHNHKNNQTDGMKGPKKVETKASHDEKHSCPFNLVIKWDSHGFFVALVKRSGCSTHKFYPQILEERCVAISNTFVDKGTA